MQTVEQPLQTLQDLVQRVTAHRAGPAPRTTPRTPHAQLDQIAPPTLQHRLQGHAASLPGVRCGDSEIAVPGTVAFFLDSPPLPKLLPPVFWGEWAHLHPPQDGSLHLKLPVDAARHLVELGWGEYHFIVRQGMVPPMLVMLFGPRDEAELQVAERFLEAAYLAAGGDLRTR